MGKILSIVVPSYNCEKFLDKCLSSFIDIDVLPKLDVIVVNDGSLDGTSKVAQKYCSKYPNSFRLISQENKGHGGALNTGLSAVTGKYVKVIDADDWIEIKNLSKFIYQLEKCNSDVVLTHHYTTDISTGEVKLWKSYPPEFYKDYDFSYIMNNWKSFDRSLTFHGITYKSSFYKEHCIQLSEHVFYEDHEYATIPCCYANSIMPFDMFIYNYRIGDVQQSVSNKNQLKRISHTAEVLNRLKNEYLSLNLQENSSGKDYYIMKIQGLLLSYITTVLLIEDDRKKGRNMAENMMNIFKTEIPKVYSLSVKQYNIFKIMNILHMNKHQWDSICSSSIYNKIRHNHDFK